MQVGDDDADDVDDADSADDVDDADGAVDAGADDDSDHDLSLIHI